MYPYILPFPELYRVRLGFAPTFAPFLSPQIRYFQHEPHISYSNIHIYVKPFATPLFTIHVQDLLQLHI